MGRVITNYSLWGFTLRKQKKAVCKKGKTSQWLAEAGH